MSFKKLWTKLFTRNSETEEMILHVAGATVRHRSPFEDIDVQRNNEELSDEFIDKWVVPFYMNSLLNANENKIQEFAEAAIEINQEIVSRLLGDFDWRTRIVAAFFAAINNYQSLEDVIGKHLLKSEVCYAGSGYCLALATFGSDRSKEYLYTYLDYYLDRKDLWFDQADGYCALEYLDSDQASKLTDKWNVYIADKNNKGIETYREHFRKCLLTLDKIRQAKKMS